MRTVFHLSTDDTDRQSELLGNIQNLLDDEETRVENIAVVLNAEAVTMIQKESEASEFIKEFPEKVSFYACSNSLENAGLDESETLEKVTKVSSGVGKLTKLQDSGYSYIRI